MTLNHRAAVNYPFFRWPASLPSITSVNIEVAEDPRPRENGIAVIELTLVAEGKASFPWQRSTQSAT